MDNNSSNNSIIKYCKNINLTSSNFVLRNNKNNKFVIFHPDYACTENENINYGLKINNVTRRDKCDKIGDLSNFSKVSNYIYAFSNTKQFIVCIDPLTFVIDKYVCLSSLEYTYNRIIANREYIYAVSDDFSHIKQFNLDLGFERKIDLPQIAKYLSIQVIANNTFASVFELHDESHKIVVFTPEGIQNEINFIMRNGKKYYLRGYVIHILNSNYFIVSSNTCCMLVSFQTNCVVEQFEDEDFYYIKINSDHEFIISFRYKSKKPIIFCYIDSPCHHDQKQEQLSVSTPTIENINP